MISNNIKLEIHSYEYPDFVKDCLSQIDQKDRWIIQEVDAVSAYKRVYLHLNETSAMLYNFLAWAAMQAYYGFTIGWCDNKFSIGGHETEEITGDSIEEILKKLAKFTKTLKSWKPN